MVDARRAPSRIRRVALGALAAFALCVGWVGLSPEAGVASTVRKDADADACKTLASRLCADVAAEGACALAKDEIAHFSLARCQAMLGRYTQVAAELSGLAAGTRELTARDQRLPHSDAPSLGPADAALTLVEFADFESADCGRAAPTARMLENLFPGRVRFVFRQYPSSRHPDAHQAAEASLAAHAQGKFWEYHDVLFANPHDLGRAALERYAAAIGLDLAAFRHALDAHLYAADVDADLALGHRVQALETPTLYANGKPVSMPYGVVELTKLVESFPGAPPK